MARYRLTGRTFINNALRDAGEIVEYDGPPGSTLQPLDAKSKADIPEDWHEKTVAERIALAQSLGARGKLSAAAADSWISNEIDNRAQAKDAKGDKADEPDPEDIRHPARQAAQAKHK